MRIFYKFLLILLVYNISFSSFAKNNDNPIRTFSLKNGHQVIIKEVHANPIVTIDTWVKTGSGNETCGINGISHFLEHLMFKGTKNHKNGEIEKNLESKGARFNAATSKDFTHYYVTIASDYFDTAIKLHADMMQNPVIPVEEMEKERKVVQEEIRRANDDPKRIILNNLFKLIFKEHPYGMTTLGPHKIIEEISREEIMKYYRKRYAPENLITVIVGDVNTNKALKLVKENFNTNKSRIKKTNNYIYPNQSAPEKQLVKIEKGKYKSGYLFMGFKGIPMRSIRENYALDMAASILGGSRSSRLYQNLKEEQNIVSAISAGHYSLKDDSVFLVSADFEPHKYETVKTAIIEEIKKFRENGATQKELERAKTLAIREFIYGNESVENIAHSIGYSMVTSGNIEHYKNHVEYIESVTLKEIKKAAQEYLDPQKLVLSVLLPEEIKVNNIISNKKTIKNNTRSELSNGIVLITSKNNSNNIISMSIYIKGGRYLEPKPGVSSLLAKTLLYGTKNRSYKDIIEELENSGISLNPGSSADHFKISLKSTKNDFDKALNILADVVNNPTFEKKYIEKNKEDILENIKKSRDRPLSIAAEKFLLALYKNHPYGNSGAVLEKNLAQVKRQDVVNYWERVFIPKNMVISLAGNMEHEILAQKIQAAFAKTEKKLPEVNYSKEFTPLKEKKIINTNYDSKAAWIIMGWPVSNVKNNHETAVFRVINSYLSGGLSSRLHKVFREDQGLAYSVGSSYSPKMDRGHFILLIGTAPENIELVKSKFKKEIQRLKTQALSDKELNNVKSKIIGNYALSQETNQSKSDLLGKIEVIDKKFGFNYDFPDLINKITAEDIINTANKYFNQPYIFSVVAPEKK